MPKYITTDFLRKHSRIDAAEDEDEYLTQCADAAEATLARDLQADSLDDLADSSGQLPADLRQALLMLAATSYENRETESPVQMHADPYYWHLIRTYIKFR